MKIELFAFFLQMVFNYSDSRKIKMALLSKNEKIANVSVENHKIILAC